MTPEAKGFSSFDAKELDGMLTQTLSRFHAAILDRRHSPFSIVQSIETELSFVPDRGGK